MFETSKQKVDSLYPNELQVLYFQSLKQISLNLSSILRQMQTRISELRNNLTAQLSNFTYFLIESN